MFFACLKSINGAKYENTKTLKSVSPDGVLTGGT